MAGYLPWLQSARSASFPSRIGSFHSFLGGMVQYPHPRHSPFSAQPCRRGTEAFLGLEGSPLGRSGPAFAFRSARPPVISLDTNLLLYAYSQASPWHEKASAFLLSLAGNEEVGISEFVLVEFYMLLRNPAVLSNPPPPSAAAEAIQSYRSHPAWQILGYPGLGFSPREVGGLRPNSTGSAPTFPFSRLARCSLMLWPVCSLSRFTALFPECLNGFVASAAPQGASGWSDQFPGGFLCLPTGDPWLFTAH
jgi:hypothetical protein